MCNVGPRLFSERYPQDKRKTQYQIFALSKTDYNFKPTLTEEHTLASGNLSESYWNNLFLSVLQLKGHCGSVKSLLRQKSAEKMDEDRR